MTLRRMAGNASFSLNEPRVTHETPAATQAALTRFQILTVGRVAFKSVSKTLIRQFLCSALCSTDKTLSCRLNWPMERRQLEMEH